MNAIRRFFAHNVSGFILFAAGIIVSATISNFLERTITLSETILFAAILLLVVAAIYFFNTVLSRIEDLASNSQITIRYIEEADRESEGIKFKGLVYKELQRLVEESQFEILNLTSGFPILNQTTRKDYLRAIQTNLKKYQYKGFKYVRINQVPPDAEKPIYEILSAETKDHCYRTLEISRISGDSKLTVAIMQAPIKRQASFLVIDRKYVVLELDGVDKHGNLYPMGMLFMEDRGGHLVEHFLKHFEELERLAKPISQAQLSEKV